MMAGWNDRLRPTQCGNNTGANTRPEAEWDQQCLVFAADIYNFDHIPGGFRLQDTGGIWGASTLQVGQFVWRRIIASAFL